MASSPIPPYSPQSQIVDEQNRLTQSGLEYLRRMETLLNQLRAAALAHGWTL